MGLSTWKLKSDKGCLILKHKPNCKNLFLKHFILLKHFWDLNRFGCKYYWVSVELRAQFKLRISVWVQDSAWVQDSIGAFEHRAPSAPSKLIPNSVAIPGVISLVEVDCARLVRSSLQWSLCVLFCMNRQLWRKTTFWCWIDFQIISIGGQSAEIQTVTRQLSLHESVLYLGDRLLFERGLSMQRCIECLMVLNS